MAESEFQDSQGYTEKPCLENPKKKKKNLSQLDSGSSHTVTVRAECGSVDMIA
jgi:hypothetical protein